MNKDTGVNMTIEQTRNKFKLEVEGLGSLSDDDVTHVLCKLIDGMAVILGIKLPAVQSENIQPDLDEVQDQKVDTGSSEIKSDSTGKVEEHVSAKSSGTDNVSTSKEADEKQERSITPDNTQVNKEEKEKQRVSTNDDEPLLIFGKYPNKKPSEIVAEYGEEGKMYLIKTMLPALEKNANKYPENIKRIEYIKKALNKETTIPSILFTFEQMVADILTKSLECGDIEQKAVEKISEIVSNKSYKEVLLSKDTEELRKVYDAFCASIEKAQS